MLLHALITVGSSRSCTSNNLV